mmetsp:Transcript_6068/g.12115  ORF Transcript_6068/g.12115 Transcript_6068/m.12115 type:complete len:92 (-) Transcript_6068:452-727(-)
MWRQRLHMDSSRSGTFLIPKAMVAWVKGGVVGGREREDRVVRWRDRGGEVELDILTESTTGTWVEKGQEGGRGGLKGGGEGASSRRSRSFV